MFWGRLHAIVLGAIVLAGISGCHRISRKVELSPEQQFINVYLQKDALKKQLFIYGNREFPVAGMFSYIAGESGKTVLIFSLEVPNRALVFKEANQYYRARFQTQLQIKQGGRIVASFDQIDSPVADERSEVLGFSREATFVVFERDLAPGYYEASVSVKDLNSTRRAGANRSLTVPKFGTNGSLLAIVPSYEAQIRARLDTIVRLIVNPTSVVPWGDTAVFYLEVYTRLAENKVVVEGLFGPENYRVYNDTVELEDRGDYFAAVHRVSTDRLPLGFSSLRFRDLSGNERGAANLGVDVSTQWFSTHHKEALNVLKFCSCITEAERGGLRKAIENVPIEKRGLVWTEFWALRDPDRTTPENENLQNYFQSVAEANRRYGTGNPSTQGWLTDRGRVFIQLGEPDEVHPHLDLGQGGDGKNSGEAWVYDVSLGYRIFLIFYDATGFGDYRLTSHSLSVFLSELAKRTRRAASH